MNSISYIVFSIIALFIVVDAGAQTKPPTGTITGSIKVTSNIPTVRRERGMRYRSQDTQRHEMPPETVTTDLDNIVVYLEGEGLEQTGSPTATAPMLNQKDAEFVPHVQAVVRGTTVSIINHDNTFHNVFSLSPVKKFNIGRRPAGESVPITFDETGVVQVFCDIHSQMTAYILVLDNSYFVKPDHDGNFVLKDVPAGAYTIRAWHERLPVASKKVTVRPGSTIDITLVLE